VRALLGVQLVSARAEGGAAFRSFTGSPTAPDAIARAILTIQGLDTRPRFHPRLTLFQNFQSFGPQDLRRFYDIQPLLDRGHTARGLSLAVLGSAAPASELPNPADIAWFYGNVSDSAAELVVRTLPNPNDDTDPEPGVRQELEMDAEMQSVAAPGAATITIDLPPASEIFTTGINDITTNLVGAVAVSTSFGSCELQSGLSSQDTQAVESLLQQGTLAGQSWFSASGDNGADDCRSGSAAAVDFPSDIPEMVAVGGTQVNEPWDQNGAAPAYTQEQVWNLGSQGGAGGGGQSLLYAKPGWQVGATPADAMRDMPDIALLSSPNPGVVCDNSRPGELSPNGGTSDAAPMAAGIFALLAERLGTRLGGINPTLYALGSAQLRGGAQVFHDVTQGNISYNGVSGFSAGPGFDLASGWGSLDVAALAAAWPTAASAPDGGAATDGGPAADGGSDVGLTAQDGGVTMGFEPGEDGGALVPYVPCAEIACDGGALCETIPEGPASCDFLCDPSATGGCPHGQLCGGSLGDAGICVPGCLVDSDCPSGDVCFSCNRTCYPKGNQTARVGDACQASSDCPAGAWCIPEQQQGQSTGFTGGYCSFPCDPQSCTCPAGASCQPIDNQGDYLCFSSCGSVPDAGCRQSYACQGVGQDQSICLPACQSDQDCQNNGPPSSVCDLSTGQCLLPAAPDAGPALDAGPSADAGVPDAGAPESADAGHGGEKGHGCGCGSAGGLDLSALLLAVAAFGRRRRLPC
ncbi:MAG: S53 family peptidase, partial [Deltaproteobacteria bacterium]